MIKNAALAAFFVVVSGFHQCFWRSDAPFGYVLHPLRGQYITKMVPRYRSAAWSIMWVVTIHNSGWHHTAQRSTGSVIIDDLDPLELKITSGGSGEPGLQNLTHQLRRNIPQLIFQYGEPFMDQSTYSMATPRFKNAASFYHGSKAQSSVGLHKGLQRNKKREIP